MKDKPKDKPEDIFKKHVEDLKTRVKDKVEKMKRDHSFRKKIEDEAKKFIYKPTIIRYV